MLSIVNDEMTAVSKELKRIKLLQARSNNGECFRLLEIDNELKKAIEGNEQLVIKGEVDDEVIVCSPNQTWKLYEMHTSNTLILLRRSPLHTDNLQIVTMSSTPLGTIRIPPQLDRLKRWLEECPFNGYNDDQEFLKQEQYSRLHSTTLFGAIQASDEEIRQALQSLDAVLINGYWRLLGAEWQSRFFRLLFANMTMGGVNLSRHYTTREQIIDVFIENSEEFPIDLINNMISAFTIKEGNGFLSWNALKICRFFAIRLFKTKSSWPRFSEFFSAWRQLTGDFEPNAQMLDGLALLKAIPGCDGEYNLTWLPAASLPLDPVQRFARLFDCCERWELARLEPFVEEAARALGVTSMELIVKFARISIDGQGHQIATPLVRMGE